MSNPSIVAASGRVLSIALAVMVAGTGCVVVRHQVGPVQTSPHQLTTSPRQTTTSPQQTTTSPQETTTSPTGTPTAQPGLPGTDNQGFVGSHARCDPGNTPAVMARTTKSLVVVCETGPAKYYYRAVRQSDGATIELPHAVRTSDGFDVTNPANGVLYQVRSKTVNIISPDGNTQSEPVIQSVTN